MGGSRNWITSLIYHKKPVNDEEKLGDKKSKKKWNMWRTSSQSFTYASSREGFKTRSSYAASSFGSEPPSFSADEAFTAAVAAVIRAPPRDFLMVKREWAATRIQAAFRAFLARQAFRALKAVVRIQAIFRGRQVRKQAAVTLRCMQALVRVQSRVRAHRKANLNAQDSELNDSAKQAEKNWCASPRSVKEVKTKLQMKQEGAIKRERAMVYALTHQSRRCPSPSSRVRSQGVSTIKHNGSCKNSPGWDWHDQRVATKPYDGHLKEEVAAFSRKSESSVSEHETVHVRKNNLTSTRVLARPPQVLSRTSSESLHDETSSSSTSLSPVPFSGSIFEDDGYYRKPSFMSLTHSTQAKQRRFGSSSSSQTAVEQKQPMTCNGDARRNDCSDSSCSQWTDLYPPGIVTGRHLWAKSQRS